MHDVQSPEQPVPERPEVRLSTIQTKSAPALPKLDIQSPTSQTGTEDFREVRLKLRPTTAASRQQKAKTEDKDQTEQALRDTKKNLSHFSTPAKEPSIRTAPSGAEERPQARNVSTTSTLPGHEKPKPMEKQPIKPVEAEPMMEPQPRPSPKPKDKGKAVDDSRPRPRSPIPEPERPRGAVWPMGAIPCEHDCDWKDRYIDVRKEVEAQEQTDDIGLEGLTIVLHMKGRDDLVINTDLRNLE